MSDQPDVEFLNAMIILRNTETQQAYWQDQWSPRALLVDSGFDYLAEEDVTRINGVQFEGDSGLISVHKWYRRLCSI